MVILNLSEARESEGQMREWGYNALDCTGTREIGDNLILQLAERKDAEYIYRLERALQSPAMSMMLRGVRVDMQRRETMIREAKADLKRADKAINAMPEVKEKWDGRTLETGICEANLGRHHKWPRGVPDNERQCSVCGTPRVKSTPFNANSADATYHLLYDLYGIQPITNKQGKESTDDDVLGRIRAAHPEHATLIDQILIVRDKKKQLGSLLARLGSNNRYYSSFNVGTAWTGRFSSSKNPFQLGGNLQNVAPKHRAMFIADPGMEIGYADYKQGESMCVAYLAGDERYIQAHLEGDTHTFVARLVWPELPWTGDLKRDKKVASQNPSWDLAEGHTYRFHSKSIQHGANFGRTPYGISMGAHIPIKAARSAYERYMTEFDRIPAWQAHIAQMVRDHKALVSPLGRSVTLMGRPWDKHTIRQGLDFVPQSMIADINDLALWRVWHDLEEKGIFLLAQVHDALLHQFPKGRYDLEREVLKLMLIPIPVTDYSGVTRIMTVGVESATGRNWGHKSEANPYGITEGPIEEYIANHPF